MRVQVQHAEESNVIDLKQADNDIYNTRKYTPIPDPETQAAWSAASEHIGAGLKTVLSVYSLVPKSSIPPDQARATADRGRAEFDAGLTELKTVGTRLQAFGQV
ncbi:hypothetical protein KCMC57_up57400 [Kitasatospora sp. CMC57]|uniref:Uncharacterized protein n=1 Tax=Kitasatospora sp. CMC57 TaxID=3231513 RepID=A0AB33K7B6_9ACTN